MLFQPPHYRNVSSVRIDISAVCAIAHPHGRGTVCYCGHSTRAALRFSFPQHMGNRALTAPAAHGQSSPHCTHSSTWAIEPSLHPPHMGNRALRAPAAHGQSCPRHADHPCMVLLHRFLPDLPCHDRIFCGCRASPHEAPGQALGRYSLPPILHGCRRRRSTKGPSQRHRMLPWPQTLRSTSLRKLNRSSLPPCARRATRSHVLRPIIARWLRARPVVRAFLPVL